MNVPSTVDICGIAHRIIFVGPTRMRKESGVDSAYGCVDPDKCIVYLAKELKKNPSLLRDTLIHEVIGHALLTHSGLGFWIQSTTKFKRKQFFVWQETFVRWHTPLVIITLRALGLLKDNK